MKTIILTIMLAAGIMHGAVATFVYNFAATATGYNNEVPVLIKGTPTNVTVTLTALLAAGGGISTNQLGAYSTNQYGIAVGKGNYNSYIPGTAYNATFAIQTNSSILVTNQSWSYTFVPTRIAEAPPGYVGFYFKVVSGEATSFGVHNTKMTITSAQAD